jgi:hypothetical protein
MFAVKKDGDENPNLYTKKFNRYKQYVKDGLVRVEDSSSKLFQTWIPRAQATMAGVAFHDPAKWVKRREDELGLM